MRIIALGDTHGRANWKAIVANESFDKVVFIGDYFDTHENISTTEQIENFNAIVAFKKLHRNKVILLLGNHDFHYLKTTKQRYTGYQRWQKTDIGEALQPAIDAGFIQMCFFDDQFLFTHAGVTKTWCKNELGKRDFDNGSTLEQAINSLFRTNPNAFKFTTGVNNDSSGNDINQSPIWVRPPSLLQDKLSGFIQIIGHTRQPYLQLSNEIIIIDTLGATGEYLVIEDGRVSATTPIAV